jgi:tRNA 2-thiocytidine biosynthesis protein TtcA
MGKLTKQTRLLISKINRAFCDYPMLSDGDKVAVAVSGGHDSLSLLHLLHIRQPIAQEHYDLVAVHILGDAKGPDASPAYQPLIQWLDASGLEYVIKPMQLAEGEKLPMSCQRCTWNRRSTLFRVANRLGCNKIALGHHFDDMVETALLNLLYQGRMASMYPYASYFGGAFALIRPLIYISKDELRNFARVSEFPDPPSPCPNSDTSKRKVIVDILSLADQSYQNIRRNIFRAAMHCMELEEGKER